MIRRRAALALLAMSLGACARPVFPPGGPIDTTPPRIVALSPADSTVDFPRDGEIEMIFSESMERATVRDGLRLYPPVGRTKLRWSGRRLRVTWDSPLADSTTYVMVLSGSVRDEHQVALGAARVARFATGSRIDEGVIRGTVHAKTLPTRGVPVYLFPEALGSRPDTAETFEPSYATETDSIGAFDIAGLPPNRGFTVHAFYDRNASGLYEPETDLLASYPQPIRLTPERSLADSIGIIAIDPRAPALVKGSIVSGDSTARFEISARGAPDSLLVQRVQRIGPGEYVLRLPPGSWRLRARRLAGPEGVPAESTRVRPDTLEAAPEGEYGPLDFTFEPAIAPPAAEDVPPEAPSERDAPDREGE